jgi:hypothetical protein
MALELTHEQRTGVITLIKDHIAEHGNCRIGWAMREVAGEKFEKSIHLKERLRTQSSKAANTSKKNQLKQIRIGTF